MKMQAVVFVHATFTFDLIASIYCLCCDWNNVFDKIFLDLKTR